MNKKITSSALAALMIAGSTSFSALAAMSNGTVVIGNKAFDLAYANDPKNAEEITNAIVADGAVFVKDFEGNWIENNTGKTVEASVIPAVVYKNADKETSIGAGDKDAVASSAVVSATSATTLKVSFNQAPADTSKVVFTVSQATSPVTVTATWNASKTEATLTKTAKFVAGDYSVKVMNDTTDLGTSIVKISEQKVAKINVTSTKLGVVNKTVAGVSTQTGYVTYTVLDQYGVDITNTAMANNVQFQTGVGTTEMKNGLLKITPSAGLNLLTFSSGIVITANDTSTGASTSATLTATSQIGTLSDIALTTLSNADNKVLTAGDTTTVFYAGFTATDISGNATTNYTLMEQGLILTGDHKLTTSSPYVVAQLVQDPTDSAKGLIKVTATVDQITLDMPVVITAMTWTGKTSQISTTLKKQAAVDSFTLQVPSDSIASNESKVIPFTALDQNGKEITKFSELDGIVTLTGAKFVRNLDGSASVKNDKVPNNGTVSVPAVISAVTPTGKYSSITINIQKPVKADALTLNTNELKSTLQAAGNGDAGAVQTADFDGAFTIQDQYGREIDMYTATGTASNYEVIPYTSDSAIISVSGKATSGNVGISVEAKGVGSATVRFDLVDKTNPTVVLDSKSQTFSVLKDSDIKDYVIDAVAKPIYVINGISSQLGMSVSDQEAEYKANPKVYGTTATGAKVVLRGTPIKGATVSNTDFTVFSGVTGGNYKSVKVVANELSDKAKTGSSATLTVTLLGADGNVHAVSTPITSSTAAPLAESIDVYAETSVLGIERDGDTITVTAAPGRSYSDLLGNTLAAYVKSTGVIGKQNVYFAPVDQYGKEAQSLSQFITVPSGTNMHGHSFAVSVDGDITGNAVSGDYITISGSTNNGYVKTIKIVFAGDDTSATVAAAALATINAGTEIDVTPFATAGVTGAVIGNLPAYKTAIAAKKLAVSRSITLAEVQVEVTTVNAAAIAAIPAALATINAGTETDVTPFATAGVTGAVIANLPAYKTAITAAQAMKARVLTVAEVQVEVNNVNAIAGAADALASLTKINNGSALIADYTTAGVIGAVAARVAAYNTAVGGTLVTPATLTLAQVQVKVDTVNVDANAAELVAALAAVNNATTVGTMQTAITDTKLGLNLTTYSTLTALNKNKVAQNLLDKMPGAGYTTAAAVQTEMNNFIAVTLGL